ncbi:MAG: hypothetical protein CEE43_12320 [Promethearchaeota archaeon Loki_b32]|nr:MAG: hypothetical protein CEE43_12320 [Candidatus Lokiarchaeota archaeon Loki_b32]
MPNIKFLEEHPLYTQFPFEVPEYIHQLEKVNINMHCSKCDNIRTFNMTNDYRDSEEHVHPDVGNSYATKKNKYITLDYLCAACKVFMRFFIIKIGEDLTYIQKIGQYPPLDISIPKELKKIIDEEYKDYYKKGKNSENFGHGIGAYVYYRRIIEGIINEFIEKIPYFMTNEEKEKYKEPLDRAKKEKNTTTKIEIIKDLVPPILIQGRFNPLKALHEALSIGIHVESDLSCLENAKIIRNSLEFIVEIIFRDVEKSKEYIESMDKIKKRLKEKYK